MSTNPADLLPLKSNAPKKSGKKTLAGRPLDQNEDFEKPLTKEKSPEQKLEALDKPTEKKGSLLIEHPESPTAVNGRMKAFYGTPRYSKYKDVVLISLQMSIPLSEKHLKLLPKIVAAGFHGLNDKEGFTRINLKNIPPQHVTFYLESDRKTAILSLPATKVISANVALIEQKGEGKIRSIVRFAFYLQSEDSDLISNFARLNVDNNFWIEMSQSQKSLWDENEED